MPERRNGYRRARRGGSGAVAALALRAWQTVASRPVDAVAILAAVATTIMIAVNALFLQAGAHQAPFVVDPPPGAEARTKPGLQAATRSTEAAVPRAAATAQPAPAVPVPVPSPRRADPIAELIGPSPRILAVQRVLSAFGYGQIKPTGMLDDATSAAIEKFEREHKLPVSGRVSDRLVGELAAMIGHPIE